MDDVEYLVDAPEALSAATSVWTRPLTWLLVGGPPGVAGAVSWFLGGDDLWLWGTLGGFVLLVIVGIASLRAAGELFAHTLRGGTARWPRSPFFATCLGLVLTWAAWVGVGYIFPVGTVKIDPYEDDPPAVPTRVVYRGEVLATLDRPQTFSFPIRGRLRPDALKVEAHSPAGWVELPFRDYGNSVNLEKIPTLTLYLDNRGHGWTKVECGEVTLDLGADSHERRPLVDPRQSFVVRIDGVDVGTLDRLEGEHALIDVSGTHNYRLREIQYQGGVLHLLQPQPWKPGPPDRYYRQRRLHRLPGPVDFFLEDPPEKVTVQTFPGSVSVEATRYQLTDED